LRLSSITSTAPPFRDYTPIATPIRNEIEYGSVPAFRVPREIELKSHRGIPPQATDLAPGLELKPACHRAAEIDQLDFASLGCKGELASSGPPGRRLRLHPDSKPSIRYADMRNAGRSADIDPAQASGGAVGKDQKRGIRTEARILEINHDVILETLEQELVVRPPYYVEAVPGGFIALGFHGRRKIVSVVIGMAVNMHLHKIALQAGECRAGARSRSRRNDKQNHGRHEEKPESPGRRSGKSRTPTGSRSRTAAQAPDV
jgi:hypothetical protein